jgi:hypothetical protein
LADAVHGAVYVFLHLLRNVRVLHSYFFSCQASKLIPEVNLLKLISEANARPGSQACLFRLPFPLVFSVGTSVGSALKRVRNAWLTARGSLQNRYRLTKPHIGWMLFENDVLTNDV